MQIVIDIPHRVYKMLQNGHKMSLIDVDILEGAIRNGTPLPEGHGRLIDGDDLLTQAKADGAYDYVSAREIANAPTIIEADKEGD